MLIGGDAIGGSSSGKTRDNSNTYIGGSTNAMVGADPRDEVHVIVADACDRRWPQQVAGLDTEEASCTCGCPAEVDVAISLWCIGMASACAIGIMHIFPITVFMMNAPTMTIFMLI